MKGKWHLSKPVEGEHWGPADAERIERDYGFGGWEPPDAGGDAKAHHFGGGDAGRTSRDGTRTTPARWSPGSPRASLPEPFCLIVSLVNPHDVLGYPHSYLRRRLPRRAVPRPRRAAAAERSTRTCARSPPSRRSRGWAWTPISGRSAAAQAKQDYVNFYAHLHRVVDQKIGRLLSALGDAGSRRTRCARARSSIRISDHGEMGLSHGGLRQKIFNAYEETIRVPLRLLQPAPVPAGARERRAGLAASDIVPTCLGIAGRRQPAPERSTATTSAPLLRDHAPGVRDAVLFTYDDHQAGTALQEARASPTASAACATSASSTPSTSTRTGGRARIRALRPPRGPDRGAQPARGPRRAATRAPPRGGARADGPRPWPWLCTDGATLAPRLPSL